MNLNKYFTVSPDQLGGAVHALKYIPALSVPILSSDFRQALLEAALAAIYRPATETVGNSGSEVIQRLYVSNHFEDNSIYYELTTAFQTLFDESANCSELFTEPVIFNDLMLQKYDCGEVGITPHRDRTAYRHIICLFVLAGLGRFGVAADRARSKEQEISNFPGDVILMPGPGFKGMNERPYHFVEHITDERFVFGLRHDSDILNTTDSL